MLQELGKHSRAIQVNPQQLDILLTPENFRTQLLQALSSATTRIYASVLYWENDFMGNAVLDALISAIQQKPDLEINIFVDYHRARRGRYGEASTQTNLDWYQEIITKWPSIHIFSIPINSREVFGVLHVKGIVVDDTVFYTGASINNVYLAHENNYRLDRYYTIQNSVIADSFADFMQQYFIANGNYQISNYSNVLTKKEIKNYRNRLKRRASYNLRKSTKDDPSQHKLNTVAIHPIFGVGARNRLNALIHELLLQAQEKIVLSTPYFNFPKRLRRDLRRALDKGIQVEIIVGAKEANDFFIHDINQFSTSGIIPYVYEMNLKRFLKQFAYYLKNDLLTVHTWRAGQNTFHAKGMWFDNNHMILSGNNLNPRSYRLDAENALIFHYADANFQQNITAELAFLKKNTKRLHSYQEIDNFVDYPKKVQKTIRKLSRIQLIRIAKYIL